MRFSCFSVLALTGLAVASPAPILNRRVDAVSMLKDLYATIQTHTGAINATIAPITSASVDKTAAIAEVGKSLVSMTVAITKSATSIKAVTPISGSKHSLELSSTKDTKTEPAAKRQIVEIGSLLTCIIVEVFATIDGAISSLGLEGLLVWIGPLANALSALLLTVETLLDTLLVSVIVLLDSLLNGLAIGLSL